MTSSFFGGSQKVTNDDKGEGGGVLIPPKSDDVIYEQPLTNSHIKKMLYRYQHYSSQSTRVIRENETKHAKWVTIKTYSCSSIFFTKMFQNNNE